MDRVDVLKACYQLETHEEGGSFSEVYTSSTGANGRACAGCIYYLLVGAEISHFHEIDCDELWLFHEGCGLKITVLLNGEKTELLLGNNVEAGERAMVAIPAGAIFAAENLDAFGYTLVSCVTAPKFTYAGFRLVSREELQERFPAYAAELEHLAI